MDSIGNIKLIDVIHFYLWQEVNIICKDYSAATRQLTPELLANIHKHWGEDIVNLSLRPLSDMTEDEKGKLLSALNEAQMYRNKQFSLTENGYLNISDKDNETINCWGLNVNAVAFLLKQGFDLFDLISSGQAIDKTKQ